MPQHRLTDEELVEKVRAFLAERKKLRWYRLIGGVTLLALCISLAVRIVQKLERENSPQLTDGFCAGVGLGFMCITLGAFGAIFLAKSGTGFQRGMRSNELLVTYHDRLRELRALPNDSNTEKLYNRDSPKSSTPG